MIEEDLFFPGKSPDGDSDSESDAGQNLSPNSSHLDPLPDETESEKGMDIHSLPASRSPSISASGSRTSGSRISDSRRSHSPVTPASSTPPQSSSPVPMLPHETAFPHELDRSIAEEQETLVGHHARRSFGEHSGSRTLVPPKSSPAMRNSMQPLHLKTQSHGHFHLHLNSRASKFPSSTVSLLSALSSPEPEGRSRARRSSTAVPVVSHTQRTGGFNLDDLPPSPHSPKVKAPFNPFLLRTLPKPPPNPRDHALLERIYTEMQASRFINLTPLSLLANSLGLYFKGNDFVCFDSMS